MLILITIVVLGAAFALVTLRRRAAARWQPDPTRAAGEPDAPWCARVWVQKVPPRRSVRGAHDRIIGDLCVDRTARAATFRVPDREGGQQVRFTNVRDVQVGARGSDFVNTWIEVRCDVDGQGMAVYLNDAKWLGWRSLLTTSNHRIADALAGLRVGT